MDDEQLKALEEATRKVVDPGPWKTEPWENLGTMVTNGKGFCVARVAGAGHAGDAAFIAAASPLAILCLCLEVRRLWSLQSYWKKVAAESDAAIATAREEGRAAGYREGFAAAREAAASIAHDDECRLMSKIAIESAIRGLAPAATTTGPK